jgi:CRISPR-associated protein Csx14
VGTKPQLVTIPVDLLRNRGEELEEVVLLHTTLERAANRASVERLRDEFRRAYRDLALRSVCLCDERGLPLEDVASERAARQAFQILYREVKRAKRAGRCVHLSIAGGRKIIGVYAMAVAQLLFDPDDRVWHLFSELELVESRALHPRDGQASLIRVPVLRWSEISPALTDLILSEDPFEALRRQERRLRTDALRKARLFIHQELTASERDVVTLMVRQGLTNAEIGQRTYRSPRTVEHHLSSAYAKARAFFGLSRADRHTLISLLAPLLALEPAEER